MSDAIEEMLLEVCFLAPLFAAGAVDLPLGLPDLAAAFLTAGGRAVAFLGAVGLGPLVFGAADLVLLFGAFCAGRALLLFAAVAFAPLLLLVRDPAPLLPAMFETPYQHCLDFECGRVAGTGMFGKEPTKVSPRRLLCPGSL